jgi:hypothetical protein
MMEKEARLRDIEREATETEAGKKAYQKAELTIHGDLKEITGGITPHS